jgi:hypothetical protein
VGVGGGLYFSFHQKWTKVGRNTHNVYQMLIAGQIMFQEEGADVVFLNMLQFRIFAYFV